MFTVNTENSNNKHKTDSMSTKHKPKVLVFDDTRSHRETAKLLLEDDYDLTIVGTYDEAKKALGKIVDYDKVHDLQKREGMSWREACDACTTYPGFDIVLTDLLVPASDKEQGDKGRIFVGQEMPLGTTIALQALIMGVKNVAVVTDMNHHCHPASAAFDGLDYLNCRLEGIKILCTNQVRLVYVDVDSGESFVCKPEEGNHDLVYGKDWKNIIERLFGDNGS